LFLDGVGLVGVLRVVGHLGKDDLLFLRDDLSRDAGLVEVGGVGRGDLHRNVLAKGGEAFLGGDVVGGVELDDDAVGAAAVDVGGAVALIAGETPDLDVLLDDKDQRLEGVVTAAFAHLAGHQGLHIGGVRVGNDLGE